MPRRSNEGGRSAVILNLSPTTLDDAEALVAIRIAAMRESLEALGRFDPRRARERFLAGFTPADCRFVEADGVRAGFVLLRPPRRGPGCSTTSISSRPCRAGASARPCWRRSSPRPTRKPRRSAWARCAAAPRTASYQRHGFVRTDEAEWDIHYLREPRDGPRS